MDKALADFAQRNRGHEDIPTDELGDRGAAKGEVLVVDYIGRINGEAFQGGTANDVEVEVGGDGFIPGFTDQLEGMRPGETRTIDVTFPDPYTSPDLAGKPAQFEIAAKKIQRIVPTTVDDALAQKLGIASLDELRRNITRRIQGEYDQLARLRLKRQLLDQLADRVSFAVPQAMVDTEFEPDLAAAGGRPQGRAAGRGRQGQGRRDAEGRIPRHRRAAGAAGSAARRDRPGQQHHRQPGRDDAGDAGRGGALSRPGGRR